jgi:hypothetical protein
MTAVAHSLDDEPTDPGEAEMPATSFEIIRRAREICGHPAARELPAELEGCLIAHAAKILSAQIRALALLAEMKERGELSDLNVSDLVETDSEEGHWCESSLGDDERDVSILDTPGGPPLGDDETDEPSVDWAQIAADAWNEGWRAAAVEYQVTRRNAYAWVRP